jgi:hypothetical protein
LDNSFLPVEGGFPVEGGLPVEGGFPVEGGLPLSFLQAIKDIAIKVKNKNLFIIVIGAPF